MFVWVGEGVVVFVNAAPSQATAREIGLHAELDSLVKGETPLCIGSNRSKVMMLSALIAAEEEE